MKERDLLAKDADWLADYSHDLMEAGDLDQEAARLEEIAGRIRAYLSRASLRKGVAKLADQYCEGWCKEKGGAGKFDDCTGCEILTALRPAPTRDDVLEALRTALEAAEYEPGDYPIVPVKIADFMTVCRAILSARALKGAKP